MKTLILVTLSYPYVVGAEQSFLDQEVRYYASVFDEVLLLPTRTSAQQYTVPATVRVDCSLAEYAARMGRPLALLRATFDRPGVLLRECFGGGTWWRPTRLKAALKDYLLVMHYLRFFRAYLPRPSHCTLLYTFWFTPVTTAAAMHAAGQPQLRTISRAHGIDLYEYRHKGYIPFRTQTLRLLQCVALVSDTGRRYLAERYPAHAGKFVTHVIGTPDEGITAQASPNGQLCVLSCSTLDANKRVHLVVEALAQLAARLPDTRISWHHFGDGPLRHSLELQAQSSLQGNISTHFHGQVDHARLMDFYKHSPVDVFVTASASEGGRPVSIAEALSCSVPVVASCAGGIPELVDASNGVLLDLNPSAEAIADGIQALLQDRALYLGKRAAARSSWEARCNATRVYPPFMSFLNDLCQQAL